MEKIEVPKPGPGEVLVIIADDKAWVGMLVDEQLFTEVKDRGMLRVLEKAQEELERNPDASPAESCERAAEWVYSKRVRRQW